MALTPPRRDVPGVPTPRPKPTVPKGSDNPTPRPLNPDRPSKPKPSAPAGRQMKSDKVSNVLGSRLAARLMRFKSKHPGASAKRLESFAGKAAGKIEAKSAGRGFDTSAFKAQTEGLRKSMSTMPAPTRKQAKKDKEARKERRENRGRRVSAERHERNEERREERS